jgi:hypothetical protein
MENAKVAKKIGLLRWDRSYCFSLISEEAANKLVAQGQAEWAENPRMAAVLLPRPGDPYRGVSAKATHKLSQRYVDAKFGGNDQAAIDTVDCLRRGMVE